MANTGANSGTAPRVGRHGKRVTGMPQISATAAIAAAVVIAMAITPPAFARGATAGGGQASVSSSGASHQPSYNATRAANQSVSGAPHPSGAGSARQFSSYGGRPGWYRSDTPPGWTGHGEKRGWEGGKTPPGLSHRDRDPQWGDRKFDRVGESGDRQNAQFRNRQLERRWRW
jgi:hypothetical protein